MLKKKMNFSHTIKNSRGLGIIELMIALGVLATAISVALLMVSKSKSSQSLSGFMIRVQSIRYSLLMSLQNDQSITASVNNVDNLSFACIRDKVTCQNAGGSFKLLDATGLNTIYDGTNDSAGFAPDGKLCYTFSEAGAGNPLCPLHLTLAWMPICGPAPDPCINPPMQIIGTFKFFDRSRTGSMNWVIFNFDFLRQKIACGADPVAFALTPKGNAQTTNSSVFSDVATQTYPAGAGVSSVMESCGTGTTGFQYANTYTGGAAVGDPSNQASVCFVKGASVTPETDPCIFEWHVTNESWLIRDNAGHTYTPPATENGDQTAQYNFVMHNGQMTFYYGGKRRYIFPDLYGYELIAVFKPGAKIYSTGFTNVTFIYQ